MSKRTFFAAITSMSVLASGCANLRAAPNFDAPLPSAFAGRLVDGPRVPAPSGLASFCAREPRHCPEAETSSASLILASAAAGQVGYRDSVWRTLISQPAPAPVDTGMAVVLTAARWADLRAINREINAAIRPATDEDRYGVAEFWTMPISVGREGGSAQGDCEDYALEKRERLIERGWPAASLSLAVAIAPGVGRHAVLVVETDRGDFVLDNLHREPRAIASLRYQWLSRQSGANLLSWAVARYEATPRPVPGLYQARGAPLTVLASLAPAPQP